MDFGEEEGTLRNSYYFERNKKQHMIGSWGLINGKTYYNKKYLTFLWFCQNHFKTTIREGHTDTHRQMDTQTHISTYRPKWPRGQVSVMGV